MAQTLDSVLKERLRAVLDGQPVTEAVLRNLSEEGGACTLILGARLERTERELAELGADPAAPFVDIAAAYRNVNELRTDLAELRALLAELDDRARAARASWLAQP